MKRAVDHLRDAERALEEALKLASGRPTGTQQGRAFGLTIRALADVTTALAALAAPENTDGMETE